MKEKCHDANARDVELSGTEELEIQTALVLLAKGRLKTLSDEADIKTIEETCKKVLCDLELCRKIAGVK